MAVQSLYQQGDAIYVELFNQLHHIADPATLTGIFGSNPSITHDNPPYPKGFAINPGSLLVKTSDGAIYLITNGCKYHIVSQAAMDHYQFKGQLFPVNSGDQILADQLAELTQSGENISDA